VSEEEEKPSRRKKKKRIILDDEKAPDEEQTKPKAKLSPEATQARTQMLEIRDRLFTLKWDYEHGQINPAKKALYEKLKKEYDELETVFNGETTAS